VTVAASSRVAELLDALTLEKKCTLTSGLDMWAIKPVERAGSTVVDDENG
jgi:hypothetical protein